MTPIPNCIAFHADKQGAHSAEVGALAPVLEKSATELKLKLLKCKCTVHIATLNARTLNRIGQLPELTVSVAEHNIDIVHIHEHRYHHNKVEIKIHETGNEWTFISVSAWKNCFSVLTP